MPAKTVGRFEIEVTGLHPCWVRLAYDGTEIRFRHDNLRDLEFAVTSAIRQANDRLGPQENIDGHLWTRDGQR